MGKSYEIDMTRGPLLSRILLFSLPLICSGVLQLLFNAADIIVVGRYAGSHAMAAVGATLNLNSLVINIFIGISIGANVLAARYFGARDQRSVTRTVQTTMTVALYGGIVLMIVGLLVARPLLVLMETPPEILPQACTYIWICFCAIPCIMLYNFGCAILRAVGDTRRPLFFLVIAGVINVLLNLFFVIVCGLEVAGVALATAISHAISAALILRTLAVTREAYRFNLKKLSVDWGIFFEMLKIGIPAGVQSSCFAISNMIIQSSINSFGSLAMAGMTAALGVEGIVYVGSFSFHQTAISFVAQNLGGRKFKRIQRSLFNCFFCACLCNLIMGEGFYLFGEEVLRVFNPNPEVIAWGLLRMKMLFTTYFLCGVMDVASGGLRGLGYSFLSAVITLFGACVFRVWWVFEIFPHYRTMENLLLSYPISWLLVAILNSTLLYWVCRRLFQAQRKKYVGLGGVRLRN